jgi:hypothetical protein
MKRLTVKIFDKFIDAITLNNFLLRHGIDAKIVTKHAVQVDPNDADKVRACIAAQSKVQ